MITGILMASGFSKRFGGNKLVAPYQGKPLFSYTITAAKASKLDHFLVVTKHPEIIDYCKKHQIECIHNQKAHHGQSQSVVLGVEACPSHANYMFFVADQPLITPEIINYLIDNFITDSGKIIQPIVANRPTSPTIFPNLCRQELLAVTGDQGGREIIKNHPELLRRVPISDEAALLDIDTQEDLARLTEKE